VTVCLSLLISINQLTILSSAAIAGGLYFFFLGFHLLARKRLLLCTPTSKIRSAAIGLVEVTGEATGPHTVAAPITGKPCFLYHTTAWQQTERNKDWEKVADETLHLPFYIDDSTGQLLIEPLGAELDLRRNFREEFDASFFSSNGADVPPRVSAFLSRHGIVTERRLRIEERSISPGDALFIAGTLTENPGVQVRPLTLRDGAGIDGSRRADSRNTAGNNITERAPAQEIINLSSGSAPATTQEMSQQAKIAAALNRAGISRPEAWSAAGVPYQMAAILEKATLSVGEAARVPEAQLHEATSDNENDRAKPSSFDLTPPVVLMKGGNDPAFVISFRSQKEFVSSLAWKSAAMIYGGFAITLLGLYVLMAQMEWL
jgi:E3 Ubiquitin ligase